MEHDSACELSAYAAAFKESTGVTITATFMDWLRQSNRHYCFCARRHRYGEGFGVQPKEFDMKFQAFCEALGQYCKASTKPRGKATEFIEKEVLGHREQDGQVIRVDFRNRKKLDGDDSITD